MKLSCLFSPLMACLALVVAGCAHSAKPGGVSVSLVDFRPTEASLLESRGTLTLRFTNENISPLGFSGSRHRLHLNGKYVGQAVSSQPIGIPPLSTATQDVEIQFENLALVRQLVDVRDTQAVAYRLDSVLFQTIYEDKFEIKTHAEGAIDLKALAGPVR